MYFFKKGTFYEIKIRKILKEPFSKWDKLTPNFDSSEIDLYRNVYNKLFPLFFIGKVKFPI